MGAVVDMRVQQVYSAGTSVSGLSGEAGTVARAFLSSVDQAAGTVVHAVVAGALRRYHGTWSQPANRLQIDVEALGNNTAGSASDVAGADADATATLNGVSSDSGVLAGRLNTTPLAP
jgi:hypothetical protein